MLNSYRTLDDLEIASGDKVLLRGDLNVPVEKGVPTDTTRLKRLVKTIKELQRKKASVVVISHFGRPKSRGDFSMSLSPVAKALEDLLGAPVQFASDCIGPVAEKAKADMKPGDVLVLENTRFHKEEEANDPQFVKDLAKLCSAYVNDAFSVAHRAHASTEGLAHVLPSAVGRDMEDELRHLHAALELPEKPLMAIVGGSKISTKLDVLKNLTLKVDVLVLGGGMANTFLAAQGKPMGKSLHEPDMLDTARQIMKDSEARHCRILLPTDVVVAERYGPGEPTKVVSADAIPENMMALDLGPATAEEIIKTVKTMKTVVWNGPLGAFEIRPFEETTRKVAQAVAACTKDGKLISVAGGGDTVAVLNMAGVTDSLSYVSIAGGAFLEWLEGRTLPGVEALRK